MNETESNPLEYHPLEPFLPEKAVLLMLGSFPPQHQRWSMEFFYPNFQNDMWRIMGLLFYDDKNHFVVEGGRKFSYDRVVEFCTSKGIAIYDTARAVIRLNDNASDKFLKVVEPTDIGSLLAQLPQCRAIVTTGQKATDVLCEVLQCAEPKVGSSCEVIFGERCIVFYRMPSSSRAYPLPLEKKAFSYRFMFESLGYCLKP